MTAPAQDPARCASFIGARKLRVTRLNSCGQPVYSENAQVVTNGFVSVEIEPESEEGDDYTTKTAGGDLCINDKGQDTIKWYTVAIEFCRVDPDLFALMNPSWQKVTSADGKLTTGWRMGQKMDDTAGFALELWPKASNAGASCLDDTGGGDDFQVNGYFLLPWVVATAPDSWTFENDAATFSLNGRTKPGSMWGRGPYNVTRDKDGNPGKLVTPIDPGFTWPGVVDHSVDAQHVHAEIVTVKPPESTVNCGAEPLWNPDATAPTVTVTADSSNGMTAKLEVTNWGDLSPKKAVVDWGDGKHKPTTLTADSGGKASYTYADADADTKMPVTLEHDNGHEPVTTDFTPKKSASGQASEDDTHTIVLTLTEPPTDEFAIDWGDGEIDTASGSGPFRHTYAESGTYDVVTTDETGSEVTRDRYTVPKEQ